MISVIWLVIFVTSSEIMDGLNLTKTLWTLFQSKWSPLLVLTNHFMKIIWLLQV